MSPTLIHEPGPGGPQDAFASIRQRLEGTHSVSSKPLSTKSYFVAMLPRTGSTALCSLLAQTGVLGHPDEYLNPRGPLQLWAHELASPDLSSYLDTLRRERATPNGVFGMKVTIGDLEPLIEPGSLSSRFGALRFVDLTRNDMVAQAISEYIAEESGVWHRDREGTLMASRPEPHQGDPEFDSEKILRIVNRFVAMRQQWERFFALYSVDPLRVSYEGFCDDPRGTVEAIASHLEIPWEGEISMSMAATSKLADQRNTEWSRRIRDHFKL